MNGAPSVAPITIARDVARRYLLGRQGLWPGRRWTSKAGVIEALHALGSVQIDPLTIVARSHDLVLWSRVAEYDPAYLDELLYQDRTFFDYGGHLDIYPMEELPYWRLHMRRQRDKEPHRSFATEQVALLDEVRTAVRERGPLGNRDFAGNVRVRSYRGRKDTGLALYHLWITGELMTHSRRGFERLYDLRERVAPPGLDREAAEADVVRYFAVGALEQRGLVSAREWAGFVAYRLRRPVDRAETRVRLDELLASGEAVEVRIEGQKEPYYAPADATSLLADLANGLVPAPWRPLESTTEDEVNFLSPLDNLLERRRTQRLFDFEYLWEIYKPVERRRWGAYTMPILYGDRLVARIDPKLERQAGTLRINGLWLEDNAFADDPAFTTALARGLAHFAGFHAARAVDLDAIRPARLRTSVRELLNIPSQRKADKA